eukprot:6088473-Amphidinium_carterae.1
MFPGNVKGVCVQIAQILPCLFFGVCIVWPTVKATIDVISKLQNQMEKVQQKVYLSISQRQQSRKYLAQT